MGKPDFEKTESESEILMKSRQLKTISPYIGQQCRSSVAHSSHFTISFAFMLDILFAFGAHLFHFLPRAVRIEKLHRLSSLLCIFAQIFLIHHAVVIHDEGHDAR